MQQICSLWSTEDVQWSKSNWTFSECQLVQEICAVWQHTGILWKAANWKWSECSGSIPPQPSITGNRPGVDATTLIHPWLEEPWNPYKAGEKDKNKRKRLIKLICKVKGQEYNSEKEIHEAKVTIDDIKMIVKAVSNIDLKMKLEK